MAALLAPEDADLQSELGRARFRLFEWKKARLAQGRVVGAVAGAVVVARGNLAGPLGWAGARAAEREMVRGEQGRLTREHLLPALRNYLNARDRCPLLSEPHMVLATNAATLTRADSRDAYLGRVKLLSGGDPQAWYLCGVQEFWAKEPGRARESWRRSLELSDRYLPQILEASARDLSPDDLVEAVLPDRPELLLAAAFRLYPEASAARERRPFLRKAVHLLENRPGFLTAEELHVKAVAYKSLGQPDEARAAYQQLLEREPMQAGWRCELAEVLHAQGQLEDARRQLVVVLSQQPRHAQARELMAIVNHELARKK
jgi:tetratricopeptide (TPR) repeat protein